MIPGKVLDCKHNTLSQCCFNVGPALKGRCENAYSSLGIGISVYKLDLNIIFVRADQISRFDHRTILLSKTK